MDAAEILKITRPADLFGKTEVEVKAAFRKLVAAWHPDHCKDPQAGEVLRHITALRDRLAKGEAENFSWIFLKRKDMSEFKVRSIHQAPTEVGRRAVAASSFVTLWNAGYEDLAEREVEIIQDFSFADPAMEREMRRYLPSLAKQGPLDAGWMTAVRRKPTDILLVDLLARRGPMPAVHAAWLCSGLLNIACWLGWAGLVHGAISPETVAIDPETHEVKLYGGWGFATKIGERPVALPGHTLGLIPRLAVKGQVAEASVDLQLVRQTIREALGDPAGSRLAALDVPEYFRNWLMAPAGTKAINDFASWNEALHKAFGERRFTAFDIDAAEIYG